MYRRPRSLEILLKIREEMAREADFDVDLFVERVRNCEAKQLVDEYSLDQSIASNGSHPVKRLTEKR